MQCRAHVFLFRVDLIWKVWDYHRKKFVSYMENPACLYDDASSSTSKTLRYWEHAYQAWCLMLAIDRRGGVNCVVQRFNPLTQYFINNCLLLRNRSSKDLHILVNCHQFMMWYLGYNSSFEECGKKFNLKSHNVFHLTISTLEITHGMMWDWT